MFLCILQNPSFYLFYNETAVFVSCSLRLFLAIFSASIKMCVDWYKNIFIILREYWCFVQIFFRPDSPRIFRGVALLIFRNLSFSYMTLRRKWEGEIKSLCMSTFKLICLMYLSIQIGSDLGGLNRIPLLPQEINERGRVHQG